MLGSKKKVKDFPEMIFIPGNVPSLKNSKVKTSRGIFSSKTVNRYIRALGIQAFSSSKVIVKGYADPARPNLFEALRPQFEEMKKGKDEPLIIGYHHVRNSKRLFDFSNSVEIIQDLLTAHGFIEDDNIKFVLPVPMTIDGRLIYQGGGGIEEWYTVDKENAGVYIKLF